MSVAHALPKLSTGKVELDTSPEAFGFLRESNDVLPHDAQLRERMDDDGYLYLRNFLDRDEVAEVRQALCETLAEEGWLDPAFPITQAIAKEGMNSYFRADLVNGGRPTELLRKLIYGDRMMEFYGRLLGGDAMHYEYTWLRIISPGNGTFPHCDIVYMGRGTNQLYTAWVPLGDVPLNVGGLVVVEGSHKNEELRWSYCQMDVDTACINNAGHSQPENSGHKAFGALDLDLRALRSRLGGRILTSPEYRMGDLLTFSVFLVHGSLDNQSRQIRMSSDSRYQLASEPADERWVGENPPGHGGDMVRDLIC